MLARSVDACMTFAGGVFATHSGWRPAPAGPKHLIAWKESRSRTSRNHRHTGKGCPMRRIVQGLFIAATLALTAGASVAAPASLDFGGSTLQRLRSGNAGSDRFTEYGRKNDGVAETPTAASGKVVATIYQMVFDISDEDAKERVIKHTAERAPAAYDSEKILELVSD
jgi:hypothetical protein